MKHILRHRTFLRHSGFLSKKQRGFSFIEVLIASAIILTNLGVISSAIVQYGEVSKKQRIITLAMDLEASIHRVVTDPNSYNYAAGGDIFQMVATGGNFPDPFTINLPVADFVGAGPALVLTWPGGSPNNVLSIYLTRDVQPCAAGAFTDMTCVMRLEIAKRKIPDTLSPTYAYAYRISINPRLNIKVMNLGVNGDAAFVDPTSAGAGTANNQDYTLFVPQYILAFDDIATCDLNSTAGLTGFNRNTGSPMCVEQPTIGLNCLATQIDKGVIVELNGANYRLKPDCQNAKSYSCPPNGAANSGGAEVEYSMQTYDPKSIDPNYVPANICVFTAANPASPPVASVNNNVHGITVAQSCPTAYYNSGVSPYGCSESGAYTETQGTCQWCSGGMNPVFPYNCLGWTVESFDSSSYVFESFAENYAAGELIGHSCRFRDTSPGLWGPCTQALTPPVVAGNITYNPTCSLKAANPNTVPAGSP